MPRKSILFWLILVLALATIIPKLVYAQFYKIEVELEFQKSEKLFLKGDLNSAIHDLTRLAKDIQDPSQVSPIKNKNDFLPKINMLIGLCFWKKGYRTTGLMYIKDAIAINPELKCSDDRYGKEACDFFEIAKKTRIDTIETPDKQIAGPTGKEKTVIVGKGEKSNSIDAQPQSKKEPRAETATEQNLKILVRVIKEGATLKLRANDSSTIIKNLPLGAIYESKEISDEWVKIVLSPDKDGNVIVGYIRSFYLELESDLIKKSSEGMGIV